MADPRVPDHAPASLMAAPPDLAPQRRPRDRRLLSAFLVNATPVDLRIAGRTLLPAALVGAAAGVISAIFFAALELVERLLLSGLAGYLPVRARGETFLESYEPSSFRPWVLIFLPAAGALLG